jgi:hypothetical protein
MDFASFCNNVLLAYLQYSFSVCYIFYVYVQYNFSQFYFMLIQTWITACMSVLLRKIGSYAHFIFMVSEDQYYSLTAQC